MKRILLVIVAAIFLVAPVFTLFLATPSPVSAGGIVLNQGFESALTASDWVATGSAGRVNTGPIHDGAWVAQITGAGGSLTQAVGVIPLARY